MFQFLSVVTLKFPTPDWSYSSFSFFQLLLLTLLGHRGFFVFQFLSVVTFLPLSILINPQVLVSFSCYDGRVSAFNHDLSFSFFQLLRRSPQRGQTCVTVLVSFSCYFLSPFEDRSSIRFQFLSVVTLTSLWYSKYSSSFSFFQLLPSNFLLVDIRSDKFQFLSVVTRIRAFVGIAVNEFQFLSVVTCKAEGKNGDPKVLVSFSCYKFFISPFATHLVFQFLSVVTPTAVVIPLSKQVLVSFSCYHDRLRGLPIRTPFQFLSVVTYHIKEVTLE